MCACHRANSGNYKSPQHLACDVGTLLTALSLTAVCLCLFMLCRVGWLVVEAAVPENQLASAHTYLLAYLLTSCCLFFVLCFLNASSCFSFHPTRPILDYWMATFQLNRCLYRLELLLTGWLAIKFKLEPRGSAWSKGLGEAFTQGTILQRHFNYYRAFFVSQQEQRKI